MDGVPGGYARSRGTTRSARRSRALAVVALAAGAGGGAGNFGDVQPGFTDKIYTTTPGLKVATTSPSGVLVTVQASNPANTNLNGLGEVTVFVNKHLLETATNPDAWEPTWTPMASPVSVFLPTGPANRTNLTVPYKLVIPGGKVLRKGDAYSENVLYRRSRACRDRVRRAVSFACRRLRRLPGRPMCCVGRSRSTGTQHGSQGD